MYIIMYKIPLRSVPVTGENRRARSRRGEPRPSVGKFASWFRGSPQDQIGSSNPSRSAIEALPVESSRKDPRMDLEKLAIPRGVGG
jgi:hypothetical protein